MSKKTRFALFLILAFSFQTAFVQAQARRYFNERSAMNSLRTIHSAQMTYQSTIGNGNFTLFEELYQAGFIDRYLRASFKHEYLFSIQYQDRTEITPATFFSRATPARYGKASRKSFYIDQTGVLRGADKNGEFADENDPPIDF